MAVEVRQERPGRSCPTVVALPAGDGATHYRHWTPAEGPVPLTNQQRPHGSRPEETSVLVMVMPSHSALGERLLEESALGLEPGGLERPDMLAMLAALVEQPCCPAVQQQQQ